MTLRPLLHLTEYATRYPGAWRDFEQMRADRGKMLPDWPGWCYAPVAGGYAVVSGGRHLNLNELGLIRDVSALTALAAWRMSKGVYRYDADIFAALWDTTLTGELPSELLYRLPEWCGYIEIGGHKVMGAPLHGFYAHLEHDARDGHRELRLLLDYDAGLSPLPVHLVGTLSEGLERVSREAEASAALQGHDLNALRAQLGYSADADRRWAAEVAPLVSLLLYLCSERPDIAGKGQPGNPEPKRVKGGGRLFAAPGVRTWEVAYRLGAAFRQARVAQAEGGGTTATGRQRPRAHVRAAHWHTYLVGRGRQERVLRWLPPIPVNLEGELPAVVRRVHGGK